MIFFLLLLRKEKTELIEQRGFDCRGMGEEAGRGRGPLTLKRPS